MSEFKKESAPRLDPSFLQHKAYAARIKGTRKKSDGFDFVTLDRLDVEYVPVEDLRPNSFNPNRMTEREFDLLLRSIEEDGFTVAILVNKDNKIIDGEHRWRAAVSLGYKEVPVVRSMMGEVQMRISTIRHNVARGQNVESLEEVIYKEMEHLGGLEWGKQSLLLDEFDLDAFGSSLSVDVDLGPLPPEEEELEAKPSDDYVPTEVISGVPEFETFMTAEAQRLQQQREEALSRAKTKEERENIKRNMAIYRLSLAFSGEESEAVRASLLGNAAEEVLQLCRNKMGGSNVSGSEYREASGGSKEGSGKGS